MVFGSMREVLLHNVKLKIINILNITRSFYTSLISNKKSTKNIVFPYTLKTTIQTVLVYSTSRYRPIIIIYHVINFFCNIIILIRIRLTDKVPIDKSHLKRRKTSPFKTRKHLAYPFFKPPIKYRYVQWLRLCCESSIQLISTPFLYEFYLKFLFCIME